MPMDTRSSRRIEIPHRAGALAFLNLLMSTSDLIRMLRATGPSWIFDDVAYRHRVRALGKLLARAQPRRNRRLQSSS
ncbi:hypothetical protein PSAC2689_100140 [Paraburkholderia sacchari]